MVGAEPRIASVAADLVAHFEERCKAQTGKAMVVERAMLDQLLQELDLGSSDLAEDATGRPARRTRLVAPFVMGR